LADTNESVTVLELIEILRQFPEDQVIEFGLLDPDKPNELIALPIVDVVLSSREIMLVSQQTRDLIDGMISKNLKSKDAP
jgi:hypothetical protein